MASGDVYTTGGTYTFPLTNVSISCGSTEAITVGFSIGDRVEIKEGYEDAGTVGIFKGRSNTKKGKCKVDLIDSTSTLTVLEESLKAKPYTKEERIMRAIADFEATLGQMHFNLGDKNATERPMTDDERALLFAIIEAGY
jgi:hypothetical protein